MASPVRPLRPGTISRTGWVFRAGILFSGVACALLVVKPILGLAVVALTAASFLSLYLFNAVLKGNIKPAILVWVLIFPLGYYFLSFPSEKSIVTLDRALPFVLLAAMLMASPQRRQALPQGLRWCAMAWITFLAVAGLSVMRRSDILTQARLFVDSFCLPALLGWSVIRSFQIRECAGVLHVLASVMAVYVACIGAAEMVLKQDILRLPGAGLVFAGSLPRPNGPFYSDDSLALIGLVTFFLLLFLRKTLGEQISFSRRVIHMVGLSAALTMALLPMFRSVAITLMLVLVIEIAITRQPGRRVLKTGLLLFCIGSAFLIRMLSPDAYDDRSRPENFYGRVAEQMQTLNVFLSSPVLGVGLGQFPEFANGDTRYLALYQGVQSMNSPHNNLGGILSETGALGFIPYVAAQIALVVAFWHLRRRRTPDARLVWTSFLYIFLSYWINGMTLASGYNSDLNLWFIFAVSVLYKYAITERPGSGDHDLSRLSMPEYLSHQRAWCPSSRREARIFRLRCEFCAGAASHSDV